MKIDFDIIEKIIDKYGSRKALSAIVGMWLISTMTVPETELWLQGVQMACIAVLGVSAVVCQWNLDKKE